MGLFWSNDPSKTIGEMILSIRGEEIDLQVERNRRLHSAARGTLATGTGIDPQKAARAR
jgi:hypothetical protein